MHSYTPVGGLDALNRLQGRAGRVVNGLLHRLRLAHAAAGVHTCAPGLVGETDEVGVGVAVKQIQIQEGRTLTVGQVDGGRVGGGRHHACGQNHHVHVQLQVLAEQSVLGSHFQTGAAFLNLGHSGFGHEHAVALLHPLVEQLGVAGGADMLIEDIGLAVLVVVADILSLLQSHH